MRFKFVFSAEWPSLPQCLALCLNIIIHSFNSLLGLALAKQVNKLHSISCDVHHSEGWGSCTFSVVDARFEKMTIPSLYNCVDSDKDERLLCPVRAVRYYLERTKQFRPSCKHLFISTGQEKKGISRNTISFWIRTVIDHGYSSASEDDCRAVKVSAHKVHSIASSMPFKKNVAVSQILQAGTWKSQSTFTKFYLREVTHKSLDAFYIRHVVAAQ